MKWIEAIECKPSGIENKTLNIKYKGKADLLVFLNGRWCWVGNSNAQSIKYPVHEDSWSAIQWLHEAESPSLSSAEEAIGFAEWMAKNQWGLNTFERKWYNNIDIPMTTSELLEKYKQSKK